MIVKKLIARVGPILASSVEMLKERRIPWRLSQWVADKRLYALRFYYDRRVLFTPPQVTGKQFPDFELHMLLGRKHVGMCLWSVKSFLSSTAIPFFVVLHDDGTLSDKDIKTLRSHLINVRVVRKYDADNMMKEKLANVPNSYEYRFGAKQTTDHRGAKYNMRIFAMRLFDFNMMSDAAKTLVLDADVLFFQEPREIVEWATDATAMGNIFSVEQYLPVRNARNEIVSFELKAPRPTDANAGLLCLDKRSFDLDAIERWIGAHLDWIDKYATFEQATYNHLIKRKGPTTSLPDAYSFNYTNHDVIATHFAIKMLFFRNVPRVIKAIS